MGGLRQVDRGSFIPFISISLSYSSTCAMGWLHGRIETPSFILNFAFFFFHQCNAGKRDATGMPIYDPDSMRVGKGGGTALCPFDCNCCFG